MRNGPYILVVAPEAYPLKKYRSRYCYEHHLVWWSNNGPIPDGHSIHHRNHNKLDNRLENLELISVSKHSQLHGQEKAEAQKQIHGTYSSYKRRGCRCDACVLGWEKYRIKFNEYRRNRRLTA